MKIGILGGGQLARMIALAGYPLGLKFIVLDPDVNAGAAGLSEHLLGAYDDADLLAELAEKADVVTYEFENVPAHVAEFLSSHTQVYPPAGALAVAQDRLLEKNFFKDLGIRTAPFAAIDSLADLEHAMGEIGYPAILKSRRMGYDGKGQVVIKSVDELAAAWQSMQGAASIVEGFVPFQREVSIIAARSPSGEIAYYPLSKNQHRGGILRVAECCTNDPEQTIAENYVSLLLEKLDYVGVIALELFDMNGELLANEFAPRVHNSGHWTIEGAETSQFENHLRAILDLPLGSTKPRGYAGMVNFIGGLADDTQLLSIPNAHLHLYDKAPRKGRKVAHATVRADSEKQYREALQLLANLALAVDES
ncbi:MULTISPECIES: 5-(carboxyamino)imidazole ribonucleotide synthase [Methylomonas]|uniref:N5-carboxyaminoimidazole ribonucleotide synthase n=2 Tax=Methylomonas TaxID=416 RepID=A0A140E6G0_9GAMM|nr:MULTISPECIES: 5-(carboxyamino)imidazole ribonucleotide synthase [Methylomonas]AMK78984.1 5-(carboxyamino)imidazole ribonucleotide synthase [Methylomonas denitrificans]OAH99161.1 5-(carboxyamino)imidazole ribonucleotide synthase [Methylomonas methanica]TCV77475.1 5-(carboxyamino)imidazole ribonucleotide synthase [Methylomonas methanica]